MRNVLVVVTLSLSLLAVAVGADWPRFLGPDATGVSPETGLAKSWPKEGTKELWKCPAQDGFGPAAIEGGKVYFMDRVGEKQEVVRCLDLNTGKEEWTFAYDAPSAKAVNYPGSRSTPAVDDKFVYTVGVLGDVSCVSKETHKEVWHKNLLKDFDSKLPGWAVAGSPVIYKDWLILAPQGKSAGLVAVAKATGEVVWKSDPVGTMAYDTPMIAKIGGVEQAVIVSASAVAGVSLADGKVLWTFPMSAKPDDPKGWKVATAMIPSPVDLGDGKIFLTGGYGGGSVILKVTAEGGKFKVDMIKKIPEVGARVQNAIPWKGHLYVNSEDTGAGLTCLDTEGNIKWKTEGNVDFDRGNLIIADGLIYMVGKSAKLYLIEASPDGYKELSVFKGLEVAKQAWAPLALSNGKLVGRDQKQFKCWDVSGK